MADPEWTAETRALVEEARIWRQANTPPEGWDYPRVTSVCLDLIERLASHIDRLEARIGALEGIISWVEPPFVDENTSDAELRQRIGFMHADILREAALSPSPEDKL